MFHSPGLPYFVGRDSSGCVKILLQGIVDASGGDEVVDTPFYSCIYKHYLHICTPPHTSSSTGVSMSKPEAAERLPPSKTGTTWLRPRSPPSSARLSDV